MKKLRLALVAGHSYRDMGAEHKPNMIQEWAMNKTLISMILPHLDKSFIDVVLIDRDNTSTGYSDLPAKINKENPDFIIEFHDNSAGNVSAKGNEVLHFSGSSKSKEFAQSLNNTLYRTLNVKDRGLKPISNSKEPGYHLLKKTYAPCVILEPAFLSNDEDFNNLMVKYGDLAINLADTLNEFLKKKL